MDTQIYPYNLHKSVLLLDNKIINWKIGSAVWSHIYDAFSSRQPGLIQEVNHYRLSVDSITETIHNHKEHERFFICHAWFKRWHIHEEFSPYMNKPYK